MQYCISRHCSLHHAPSTDQWSLIVQILSISSTPKLLSASHSHDMSAFDIVISLNEGPSYKRVICITISIYPSGLSDITISKHDLIIISHPPDPLSASSLHDMPGYDIVISLIREAG